MDAPTGIYRVKFAPIKVKLLCLFLCLWNLHTPCPTIAQDVRFSDALSTALWVSPAEIAQIPGQYRVAFAYRNQWTPIDGQAFTSYLFSGDVKFLRPFGSINDYWGIGLVFFSDRFNFFGSYTNHIALGASYSYNLHPLRKSYLSAGLQFGITQRGISYEKLTFEDQFNGINGYTLPTNEPLPPNVLAFPELSVGLHFSTHPSQYRSFVVGLATYHILPAQSSFYSLVQSQNVPYSKSSVLFRRFALYGSFRIAQEGFAWYPSLRLLRQGPHLDISSGLAFRKLFYEGNVQALRLTTALRLGNTPTSPVLPKAVEMGVGVEFSGLFIHAIVTQAISDLNARYVGLFSYEFSISYIGEYTNDFNFCPSF